MRLELNAGGLGGVLKAAVSIKSFDDSYKKMMFNTKVVTANFKAVKQKVYNMNGGVGNLQTAVSSLDRRISKEEKKVEKLEKVNNQFAAFLRNAIDADIQVSKDIIVEKLKFYNVNPWARPPRKKSFLEQAGEWLYNTGKKLIEGTVELFKNIGKGIQQAFEAIKSAVKSVIQFCKDHWKSILKIVIGVAITAALALLSNGTAIPLLAAAWKGALVGGILTGGYNAAKTGYESYKETGKVDWGQTFDSFAGGYLEGTITGAASSVAGGSGAAILKKTGSLALAKIGQVFIGGVSQAGGGVLNNYLKFRFGEMDSKDIFKDVGWDFVTGASMEAISITASKLTGGKKSIFSKEKPSAIRNAYEGNWKTLSKASKPQLLKIAARRDLLKKSEKSVFKLFLEKGKTKTAEFFINVVGGAKAPGEGKYTLSISMKPDKIVEDAMKNIYNLVSGTLKDNFSPIVSGVAKSVYNINQSIKGVSIDPTTIKIAPIKTPPGSPAMIFAGA